MQQGLQSRRVLLIVNPRAGGGVSQARVNQALATWRQAGITTEVRYTRSASHTIDTARQEPLVDFDAVCVSGGDGTVRDLITGLMTRSETCRLPIGVLPGGTGNSLLMHGRSDAWSGAVEAIAHGATRPLDVARVSLPGQTLYCTNLIGWCSAAEISAQAEAWRWLGRARYSLAALAQIAWSRPQRLSLTCDGERLVDDFLLVLACNTRYGGRRMLLAPHARTDDGQLDLLLVRRATRGQQLQFFRRINNGGHVDLPFVEFLTFRQLTVERNEAAPVTLDGDLWNSRTATVEIVPAAIRLFA